MSYSLWPDGLLLVVHGKLSEAFRSYDKSDYVLKETRPFLFPELIKGLNLFYNYPLKHDPLGVDSRKFWYRTRITTFGYTNRIEIVCFYYDFIIRPLRVIIIEYKFLLKIIFAQFC